MLVASTRKPNWPYVDILLFDTESLGASNVDVHKQSVEGGIISSVLALGYLESGHCQKVGFEELERLVVTEVDVDSFLRDHSISADRNTAWRPAHLAVTTEGENLEQTAKAARGIKSLGKWLMLERFVLSAVQHLRKAASRCCHRWARSSCKGWQIMQASSLVFERHFTRPARSGMVACDNLRVGVPGKTILLNGATQSLVLTSTSSDFAIKNLRGKVPRACARH